MWIYIANISRNKKDFQNGKKLIKTTFGDPNISKNIYIYAGTL